jgi:radical SAM protein with 4Fe4S-binding SPASM domain
MSSDVFDRVISQVGSYAQRMTLHITGEPMMNSRLFEMVRRAHERKIFTYFSTNYNLMTAELLPQLFESGLDKIRICLDGFTQESYGKYRRGGNVEKLKQAIAMTLEERRRRGASRPVVQVQIIKFLHVQQEIPQIRQFCEEHGVDQIFIIPDGCNFDGSDIHVHQGKPYSGCFWPYLTMVIDYDGSVYPCGQGGFDIRSPYGNVKNDAIDSIWNNELYTETRRFLAGRSTKRRDLQLLCYDCPWSFGQEGLLVMPQGEPYLARNREDRVSKID